MITIPGKIPIRIHPLFWLLAALIGWFNSGSILGILIWIGIIFFSVLVHEFGHALTALFFKKKPTIDLVLLGGVTTYSAENLSFGKQFLIVFNGPFFGFLLFAAASLFLSFPISYPPLLIGVLTAVQIVNLIWSVVNLVPVIPLDGGQLLRIALEGFFGLKGIKLSFLIGTCVAGVISLGFFLLQQFIPGAFFFLFAFQSFDTWRKARLLSNPDTSQANREKMQRAEEALATGRMEDAKTVLQEIRQEVKVGMIYNSATQYLALIFFQEKKRHEAYELLLLVKEQLSDEAICVLHELAHDEKNFRLVADLGASCYQFAPTQEVALRNARAFAFLGQAKPAGGWLQTAWNLGSLDIEKILKESIFDEVRKNPEFLTFTAKFTHG